eukprot:GFKZ01011360.1.p1 GENE.GFKZ01011360.1~~GFKZ01011360.1.p1  ORF type:complete len:331 (+),score=16.72 GFKZ01011360.1:321-1313(+)
MKLVALFLALVFVPVLFASPIDDDDFVVPENVARIHTVHANEELDTVGRQRRVPPCGQFCAFRMCNYNGVSFTRPKAAFTVLSGPNTATLPYICKPGASIGRILGSLPARVFHRGNFVPVSRFSPPGLDTRYPDTFINTRTIPFLPWSGIARETARGNQWEFMHDRCMIMPITTYEEIDPETELVQRRVHTDGSGNNCVAFRTTAPVIQIELLWDSGDDFDLSVEEPDGDVIAYYNRRSEAGRLNGDNNVGFCDTNLLFGKENIVYLPGGAIEEGTYTVRVRHYNKCGRNPTVWRARVMINGVPVVTRRGVASRGNNQEVLSATFTYPQN